MKSIITNLILVIAFFFVSNVNAGTKNTPCVPLTPSITAYGPTTFCYGGFVTLDAGVYASYFWTDGSTNETMMANTTGTYVVTVTDGSGCTGTASQDVTVNGPSVIINQSGPTIFCEGGSVTLDAGVYPSYIWSDGSTTETILATTTNTYGVTVTDGAGCTGISSQDITVNANPTPHILTFADSTFCQGDSVNLDAGNFNLNAFVPYTNWLWSSGETTEGIEKYAAGIFTVTVTDANGCTGTTAVHVNVYPNPTPVITANGPTTSCSGGTVVLDAGIYSSYHWSTGNISRTVTVGGPATYVVTVTDSHGCKGTGSQYVNLTGGLVPVITGNLTLCSGSPGTTLDAGVHTSYLWSNGSTTETTLATSSGTYTVTATNNSGCTGTASVVVISRISPTPFITPFGLTSFCQGGSLVLTTGAFPSYLWSNGATDDHTTVTTSSNYTLTVTNVFGCTGVASQVVTVWASPTPIISANGPTTFCTGSNVTLDAGTYSSYAWNTTEFTQTIVASSSNTYIVTVTDANGCTGTASQVVSVNATITPTIAPSSPTTFCAGGSVTLNAGNYPSYLWSDATTNQTLTTSNGGTYTVTVTLYSGCTGSASTLITVHTNPTPTITHTGSLIFCDGDWTVLDAGLYPHYSWNTGDTIQVINAYSSGTYYVIVTDNNGCTSSASIPVLVHPLPHPSISANGPTSFCTGGSVTLTSNSYFAYVWSSAETTQAITVNTSGNYVVTVTDNNGCTGTAGQVVAVTSTVSNTITPSGPTTFCNGGSVSLNAGAYNAYVWSTSQTTATITVSSSGTYSVTVSGNNGCTGVASTVVVVNSLPTPSITPSGPTSFCNGGSINLNPGSYASYLWSNGYTGQSLLVSTSGTYSVTVTDNNGCTGTNSIPVTVYSNPSPTITPSGPTIFCSGGSVTLNAGTYNSYLWNNGLTTSAISATTNGTYTVTVSDIHGCTGTAARTITVNPVPVAIITPNGPTTFCQGDSVKLDAGLAATYHWNTGASTEVINVITNGTYYVTLTNGFNCSAVASQAVVVHAVPVPVIFANGPTTFCAGPSVNLDAGVWATYSWSTSSTNEVITVNTSGTYIATVTNAFGCSGTGTKTITVNPNPTPAITPTTSTTFCQGGSVILSVSTYTAYIWNTGATTRLITANANGPYNITVTDANGCTGTATIVVTVNVNPTPVITPSGPASFCTGGSVSLTTGTYSSYNWSNSATTQSILNITTTGNFTVTVTDIHGCTATATQAVIVYPVPTPTITPSGATTFCNGGSVSLSASPFASYLWSNGATTQSITVTTTSNYTVTVTNLGNCTATASQSVTVNPLPTPIITPSGPVSFCSGNSVNLDAGTYASYHWSTGASTQVLSNVNTSGNYIVTVTSAAGCTGTTALLITVNALPTPVITANGPVIFCIGGSVILNAGTGYISYSWSTGQSTNSINVNSSSNYIVTVTNNNGCTGTTTQTVTVNPLPTPSISANGPVTFCSGDNVTLDAGPWSTYHWSTGASTETINVSTSGTFTVTITNNNGCAGNTAMTVTVNALPTVTYINTTVNLCITWPIFNLTGGSPAGGTYTGTGVTLNQFNPSLANLGPHTVTYTYTDGNGCTNFATHGYIVNACTDVPTIADGSFIHIFPNPNDGYFTIDYNVATPITGIRIMDVTGRTVHTESLTGTVGTQTINASELSKGVYFWELISGNDITSKGKMMLVK